MTWDFMADKWADISAAAPDYFPHADTLRKPVGFSDMLDLVGTLAQDHDLTLSETAELLDDMVMTAWVQSRYVSEVTHKMVASS